MSVLNTFSEPFYDCQVTLDGRNYVFNFEYSQREERWYFDISLNDGTPIAKGIKVVCGVSLLRKKRWNPNTPAGELFARASGKDASPPKLEELGIGKRVQLCYVSRAELDRLESDVRAYLEKG